MSSLRRFLVDPPRGSGFDPRQFDLEEQAQAYATGCPPHTRIVDRAPPSEYAPRVWQEADPAYYRGKDPSYDAIDVISNFGLDFDLGCAVKYILRAGRKPGNDFLQDLRKAKRVLERRIAREEGATKTVSD